jgi:hypothetical protein
MEIQDFRIGNYVKSVLDGSIYEIDLWALGVIQDGNYQNSYHPDVKVFEPIEVKADILLKFGFKKVEDFDVYSDVWGFKGFMVSLGDYINIHVDWAYNVNGFHSIRCYEELFIHQLQNLYYELMDKEELRFEHEESEF